MGNRRLRQPVARIAAANIGMNADEPNLADPLIVDMRIAATEAVSARAVESPSRIAIFIALVLGGIALITACVAVALALLH